MYKIGENNKHSLNKSSKVGHTQIYTRLDYVTADDNMHGQNCKFCTYIWMTFSTMYKIKKIQ